MNELQRKILAHLSQGGSERAKALDDLYYRDVFSPIATTDATRRIVEKYLKENLRGFCVDGIQRFRDAVGLNTHKVVVELEVTLGDGVWSTMSDGNQGFLERSVVAREVGELVGGYVSSGRSCRFEGAKVLSCRGAK